MEDSPSRNPYSPPKARVDDVDPDHAGKLANLTRWTLWALYAQIAISTVAIVSGALEYQLLREFQQGTFPDGATGQAAAQANDQRQGVIGVVQVIIFLVSGVLILMWIYRANANARARGAQEMRFTPGWSVGWYFIPFANLVMPYRALKEIWQASAAPQAWRAQEAPATFALWWTLWIVSGIANQAALRLSMGAKTLVQLLGANIVTLFSDIISIPLALVFAWLVKHIASMQARPADSSPAATG